jgi:hypothetical protein
VSEFTQGGLAPHEGMVITGRVTRVPPAVHAKGHLLFTWLGGVALAVVSMVVAAAALWRKTFARRRIASIVGTVVAVAGVTAVVWDVADDLVASGLWSASVGDPALLGLSGMLAGGSLVLISRSQTTVSVSD